MTGESLAARAGAPGRAQPAPLRRLPRARRASPCCSSAWPRRRPSSSSATCGCRRARASTVGDYTVTYVRATAASAATARGTGAPISLGAVMRVRKGDETLHAAAGAQLLPDAPTRPRARSRASSRARPPARSTCAGACAATSGWRSGPTSCRSQEPIARADRKFADSPGRGPGDHHPDARRALPPGPAAGGLPRDRLAAGDLDLDRRRDRACWARSWPPGRRPRRACAGCARSTRPASAASCRAPEVGAWSTRSP